MTGPRIRAQAADGKLRVGVPVEACELPEAWQKTLRDLIGDSLVFEIDATDRRRIRLTGRGVRTQEDK